MNSTIKKWEEFSG
jgi:thiol-disulfide isomerase/thioredoxin